MTRRLNTGLIGLAAAVFASTNAPIKHEAYLPAGVRKPTFTERRKAEKMKAKQRKR